MSYIDEDLKEMFREWYIRQMPALYRYIWYQVGDKGQAEDLTAAVCERALHKLGSFNPERGTFNAWIFGIARNEILMSRRTFSRQPDYVSIDEMFGLKADIPPIEGEYQMQEMITFILKKLVTLPEQTQDIIALRYGAGFSNQEIAGLTSRSENNVSVIIHRALKTLRKAFELEYDERKWQENLNDDRPQMD